MIRPKISVCLLCLIILNGCGVVKRHGKPDGPPKYIPDLSRVHNAVPKAEPLSRYGNRFGKGGKSNSYVTFGRRYSVLSTSRGYKQRGGASWYGTKFHGRRTSSGEPYDMFAMTGAHRTLPLPTYARVTNLSNHKSIIIKINDRGPFHSDRILDLSYVAASKLGVLGNGTAQVEVESIDPRDHPHIAHRKQPTHHTSKLTLNNTQRIERRIRTKSKNSMRRRTS